MKPKLLVLFTSLIVLFVCCQQSGDSDKTAEEITKRKASIEDVEREIRANIDDQVKEGNGYFTFYNDSIELSLKLVRVHTEYLSVLDQTNFFACVDLATENGDVYDVDFFMKGNADKMKVTKTKVHKLNGKPYYTWKQRKDKTWFTVPIKDAGNRLLGVVEGQDNFIFDYSVLLPEIKKKGHIWIPLATSDRFQQIEVLEMNTAGYHQVLKDDQNQNSILYMELGPEDGNKTISVKYDVRRTEKGPYRETASDTMRYLEAAPLLPVGDRFGVISDVAIEQRQANTTLMKARALYDYIIDNMRYAKEGTYGTGDANYACDSKSGNCTEFHSFFISLARSAGIPARFAVGAAIPSERNEGGVDGYHCWAEFYAEGQWWPVDISEANKYTPLATYYFGHHPANRIEFSRGRHISPNPSPESGPINFLAYPVLEINGKPEYVSTKFSFTRKSS